MPVAAGCRAAYLIGEDAPTIAAVLRGGSADGERRSGADPVLELCGSLCTAVARARAAAVPGDVILLSPACASFDQFEDFEARGQRFRELAC